MSVRYWTEVSDYLAGAVRGVGLSAPTYNWPACLRPVWRGSQASRGTHWWLFEDDDASPELEGKLVELSVASFQGVPFVATRQEADRLRPRPTLERDSWAWERVATLVAECETKGIPVPRGMPVIDDEHVTGAVVMLSRLLGHC